MICGHAALGLGGLYCMSIYACLLMLPAKTSMMLCYMYACERLEQLDKDGDTVGMSR